MFTNKKLKSDLKNFIKIYNSRPINDNYSGMKIEHCFALYSFLKKIKPKYVIESGVWKGQTTWLIKKALHNVKIFSIDIDFSARKIFYKDVKYLDKDISKYNWDLIDKKKTLIIFDDHVCFSKRLKFLRKNNFKHIVFDDNLPNGFIGYYTPKIIFEKKILIKNVYIRYSNIKRFFLFLIKNFIFNTKKKYNKLKFYRSFVKITYPPLITQKLKDEFKYFRKKIKVYYEFPPIVKFNFNKRFNYMLKNFGHKSLNKNYKVKKPITNINNLKIDKKLLNEFSLQYGNICYIKLS